MSLLGDGWLQVESLSDVDGDEYEQEEEVSYVIFDLGVQPPGVPDGPLTSYRLINLDTPTPYIQLGKRIFQGEPQTLLGTEMLMRDIREAQGLERHVTTIATTQQRVRFREVSLKEKEPEPEIRLLSSEPEPEPDPVPESESEPGLGPIVPDPMYFTSTGRVRRGRGGRPRGRARERGRGRGRGGGGAAADLVLDAENMDLDGLVPFPREDGQDVWNDVEMASGLPPVVRVGRGRGVGARGGRIGRTPGRGRGRARGRGRGRGGAVPSDPPDDLPVDGDQHAGPNEHNPLDDLVPFSNSNDVDMGDG